jgi:PleD family two-component response regulator
LFSQRHSCSSNVPSPTLSIGFTQAYPPEHASAVIGRADRALYAAKRSGRNRINVQPLSNLYEPRAPWLV